METYCSIFVDARLSSCAFASLVSRTVEGQLEGMWASNDLVDIGIVKNDDYRRRMIDSDVMNSFVYYPFKLEVDFRKTATIDDCIREVNRIIQSLMIDNGYKVVVACEYEHLLMQDSSSSPRQPRSCGN